MWLVPVVAGLGHYKNRAEKPRTVDSSSSSSAVLNTTRLEGPAVCKTERLQALATPLGPFDKNYSRKRLREHSLDRTDCECSDTGWCTAGDAPLLRPFLNCDIEGLRCDSGTHLNLPLSSSLPQTFPGLEQLVPNAGQHALVTSQPPHTPAVHVVRERHAAGPRQPERPQHTCKDTVLLFASLSDDEVEQLLLRL